MVGLDCASGLCDADNAVDMLIRPLADRDVLTGQEAFFAKTKAELVVALAGWFSSPEGWPFSRARSNRTWRKLVGRSFA